MLNSYWKQFKSGTDVRGIASNGVDSEIINLNQDVINKIILGFVKFLEEKENKSCCDFKISVGNDSRISADRIKKTVISSLINTGVKVINTGLSSTPAMFMTTKDLNCDAAIEITASHHPFNRNGLKFFTKEAGVDSEDLNKILFYAQTENFPILKKKGTCVNINYMKEYSLRLKNIITKNSSLSDSLKNLKIVVDAGNGAGGFYAEEVLKPLGVDVSDSQFLNPDGMFPNHIPNPENKEAVKSVREKVLKSHADLGIIFDADVDRAAVIDSNGKEINKNCLIALASVLALEDNLGGTIVTDSITSDGLKIFIEKDLKSIHRRYKRGYKNVINESKRLNKEEINSPLAIETSGHAAFRENYFLDDGAYLVTKIIIKMIELKSKDKILSDLIKNLQEPKESIEIRIPIKNKDFKNFGEEIIENLKEYSKNKNWIISKDNEEGIRVSFNEKDKKGWFLLRLSVHDPVMPLNIESDVVGGCDKIIEELDCYFSQFDINLKKQKIK